MVNSMRELEVRSSATTVEPKPILCSSTGAVAISFSCEIWFPTWLMRALRNPWRSRAAWNSEFSFRSPRLRASAMRLGISTWYSSRNASSSCCSFFFFSSRDWIMCPAVLQIF